MHAVPPHGAARRRDMDLRKKQAKEARTEQAKDPSRKARAPAPQRLGAARPISSRAAIEAARHGDQDMASEALEVARRIGSRSTVKRLEQALAQRAHEQKIASAMEAMRRGMAQDAEAEARVRRRAARDLESRRGDCAPAALDALRKEAEAATAALRPWIDGSISIEMPDLSGRAAVGLSARREGAEHAPSQAELSERASDQWIDCGSSGSKSACDKGSSDSEEWHFV